MNVSERVDTARYPGIYFNDVGSVMWWEVFCVLNRDFFVILSNILNLQIPVDCGNDLLYVSKVNYL